MFLKLDPQALSHFNASFASFLHGLATVVETLAPLAEVAGAVTGQPEITAAAKLADLGAVALDNATSLQPKPVDIAPIAAAVTALNDATKKQAI